MAPKIVVVGSANMDMVVQVQHLPGPGETVLGGKYLQARGGKGANQAVAAARLGAEVTFVARVGADALGEEAIAGYQAEGIHTEHIVQDAEAPSGVALILVNAAGENMIAVAPGANARLSPQDVQACEAVLKEADCLLVQLEIPLETVAAAVRLAKRHGVKVILNPAPAAPLAAEVLAQVDYLTPNETEAAMLAGLPAGTLVGESLRVLQAMVPAGQILVTLGKEGALIAGEPPRVVPAAAVKPVDTTAAGDAFNGALAVALGRGEALAAAVRFANAAAALSTTRAGAQPSLPRRDEVTAFLNQGR